MNHIEFIEKHVREELIRQGFTVAVAQGGGHTRQSTCTSVCHRPVARGGFLMMLCAMQRSGRRSSSFPLTVSRKSAASVIRRSRVCSEKVKAALVGQQRLSGGVNWINSQE